MKKLLLLLLVLPSFCVAQETTTLRIDPDVARGGSVSQIFDTIIYTPLETTKESLFGLIDKLEITDKYFVILDRNTNAILFFTKDGKFYKKIKGGNSLSSSGESITWLTIDREQKLIQFIKAKSRTIYCYDYEGNFVKEIYPSGSFSLFFPLPSNLIAYSYAYKVSDKYSDSINYLLKIKSGNEIKEQYFPYNQKASTLGDLDEGLGLLQSTSVDSIFYVTKAYDYTIYKVTPQSLQPVFKLIFPQKYSLPDDFLSDKSLLNNRSRYYSENFDKIISINNIFLIGNNLLFKLNANGMSNSSFIYNTITRNLYCLENVASDSSSFFLPVTQIGTNPDFATSNFLCSYNDFLYTSVSSLAMMYFYDFNSKKGVEYNNILQNYFATQDRKSNPVIIQLKLKENL